MQLTFTLNLRRYPSGNKLHEELRDLGYADGGFIPPRYGFNRQTGQMNYPKLLREAQRLDRLCPDWVPFVIDLEKAFRWYKAPNHPSVPDGMGPDQCYDLIRETYNFMRLHFPERYLTDWGRNAMWTNPGTDRLGCGLTCVCPNFNHKSSWDNDQWLAVRTQEYDENLTWRMPVYLWLSDYCWGPSPRPLSGNEWQTSIDFAIERQPDWIIYSGAGLPDMIKANAEKLVKAIAREPGF